MQAVVVQQVQAVGVGSDKGAAIEFGRNEVWETVFFGDETSEQQDNQHQRNGKPLRTKCIECRVSTFQ